MRSLSRCLRCIQVATRNTPFSRTIFRPCLFIVMGRICLVLSLWQALRANDTCTPNPVNVVVGPAGGSGSIGLTGGPGTLIGEAVSPGFTPPGWLVLGQGLNYTVAPNTTDFPRSVTIPITCTFSTDKASTSILLTQVIPLTSPPVPNDNLGEGVVGLAYPILPPSGVFTASGGALPYTWSARGLPPGLGINPRSGSIGGVPTVPGTFVVAATVTDAIGQSASSSGQIRIDPALAIATAALPEGALGSPYAQYIFDVGGPPESPSCSSWVLLTGTLPTGLSLVTSEAPLSLGAGLISGTPRLPGRFSFTVRAQLTSCGLNITATQTYTLGILGITAPKSLATAMEGTPYKPVTFTATGGTGNYRWSATNLPNGFNISPAGVLSGTAASGSHGFYTAKVTVQDLRGSAAASAEFMLAVNAPGLTITSPNTLSPGTEGIAYGPVTFTATGGVGGYMWSASGLPNGLAMSPGGVLSGTPAGGTQGSYKVNVSVADANGTSVSSQFALTINCAPNPPAVGITLSTEALSFAYVQGGALPAPQTLQVMGVNGTTNYTASVATTTGGNWLAASPTSGQTPGNVLISVQNLASLSPATTPYQGIVTVQPESDATASQTVTVSLQVTAAHPQISLSTTDLRYQVTAGSPAVNGFVRVLNTGSGSVSYSADPGPPSPVTITCGAQGTATGSSPGLICLKVDPTGLPAGTYVSTLAITGGGQQLSVSVTLEVSFASNSILLSGTSMTFTAVAGANSAWPANQTVSVLNAGRGTMNWTAQVSDNSPWLTITPEAGSSQGLGVLQPAITFTANPSGLVEGNYYALVNVTAPDGSASNSPAAIVVFLRVLPAGSQASPTVSTSGLIFTATTESTGPAAQGINVFNPGQNAVSYQLTASTEDGQAWLSASPQTGSLAGGESAAISVQIDPAGLLAGVYHGQVNLVFSDGSSQNVDVVFLLTKSFGTTTAARSLALQPAASSGPCSEYGIAFVQPVPTDGGTVVAGLSYILQLESLCVPDPPGTLYPEIDFSDGSGPLYPVYDSASRTYAVSWTPANSGNVVYYAQTNPANATSLPSGATATQPFGVTVNAADPSGSAILGGVRNAASFAVSNEVAAGSLITIFGQQLAATQSKATSVPLPTNLGGMAATLGGIPLPLYFADNGQVNAVVPFLSDQSLNAGLPLVVQRNGTIAPPLNVNLVQFQPGIFSTNQAGSAQGVIVNAENQLVDANHPAKPGDAIVIYCTGLGPVTNPPLPGHRAGLGSVTINTPRVYIDGVPSQVVYTGLSPGSVQLYQVNAIVPAGIHSGPIGVYLVMSDAPSTPVKSNVVTIN